MSEERKEKSFSSLYSPLEILRSMGLKGADYRKMWNKLHPERVREAKKKWEKAHPEKVKKRLRKLRQKWRDNGGRIDSNKRYYAGAEKAKFKGKPWDLVDECRVLERKITDKELTKVLGRSLKSIEAKRCKLIKKEKE
jgi:hypothetical protein